MREITRVRGRQAASSAQEILESAAPEVLVSELDRMMYMLSSLRPVYPVVGTLSSSCVLSRVVS